MQLDLIVGSTTYSLTNGAPYSLESAYGLGMPPVQRHLQSTPRRDGATDHGHTYNERVVTLSIHFTADDALQRDERRDTLQSVFGPGTNMPLVLQATRDDGQVRRLDVVTSGMSDIALEPSHDVAHLHRVVVQLRAADPFWYPGGPMQSAHIGTGVLPWYLAKGHIDKTIDLLDARETEGLWNWTKSDHDTNVLHIWVAVDFDAIGTQSVVFFNTSVISGLADYTMQAWVNPVFSGAGSLLFRDRQGTIETFNYFAIPSGTQIISGLMNRHGHFYYLNGSSVVSNNMTDWESRATRQYAGGTGQVEHSSFGSILAGAVYQNELSATQSSALMVAMREVPLSQTNYTNYDRSGTITPDAFADDYAEVILTGYLKDFQLENVTTGRGDILSGTVAAQTSLTMTIGATMLGAGALRVIPGTPNVFRLTASGYDNYASGTINYNQVRYAGV